MTSYPFTNINDLGSHAVRCNRGKNTILNPVLGFIIYHGDRLYKYTVSILILRENM